MLLLNLNREADMDRNWKYGKVQFEADQYSDVLIRYAPWSGHRQFGYDLIAYYKPNCLVELGSHYGCSAFTFMQAIKDNNLNTKIYPIDLWDATDIYTAHDYERDVYGFFKMVYEKCYADLNVNMMKMSFDQANELFENNSIDIIHIDGSHEYKDVRHDYEYWLPKMKKNGIMIFHDISDQKVLESVMGSHIFWEEVKRKYNTTVELRYSWGLGILFLSKEVYRDFVDKVDLNYYLTLNTYEEATCKDQIRRDYFRLQDDNKWIESLKSDIYTLNQGTDKLLKEIDNVKHDYEKTLRGKDEYIEELQKTIDKYEVQNKKIQDDYEQTIAQKDEYILKIEKKIDFNEEKVRKYKQIIKKRCRKRYSDYRKHR